LQGYNFSGISAHDLHVWRGDRHVLRGVSLTLEAGECLIVTGPNGSGKTTLLRVVAGLLPPEEGRIESNGREMRVEREAWQAELSYLAHSDGLKPELTARENLAFDAGLRRRLRPGEAEDALARVGLAQLPEQPAGFMSAGQRRRLALARVLLTGAPLWILDEPFTNLDAAASALVATLIGCHLDGGGAALVAAHQLPAIPNHAARRLELA